MRAARIILVASLFVMCQAGNVCAGAAKLSTPLKFLKHARETGFAKAKADRPSLAAALSDNVTITVKFDHVLSSAETRALEQRGVSFFSIDGAISHTGPFYAARVPWTLVDELAAREDVLKLESAWRPRVFP